MEIFIGKIIKEVTEKRGISKSELGRRLNMSPTNIHKIFKRDTIDTGLLQKLAEVLDYDFFMHYISGKGYDSSIENPGFVSEAEAEYKRALQQTQEKVVMLEKIQVLLEEKIQRLEKNSSES